MKIEIKCDARYADGAAKGVATARIGESLLHEDRIDLCSAASRARFAKAVQEKSKSPELAGEVDELLLAELERVREQSRTRAGEEFDVGAVVRPDLFLRTQIIGLSIPQPLLVDGKPAAKWMLYTRRRDGTREVRALPDCLELADGTKLWIDPRPCDPTPSTAPGWTPAARRRWLSASDDPDPVAVFRRLCEVIDYFIDFPAEHAPGMRATLALWIMLTYVYPAWDAVPYLYVGGPLGSGKSRVLEVLARTVLRAVLSSNMTAACLFRTLHDGGGSLLLDEAERLKDGTPDAGDIRSILLAGYKRGGKASRVEKVGDGFKPVSFDCYGPKALSCIAGVPPTLASRCIQFVMFRAAPGSEKPKRRIDAEPSLWSDLRNDLHALALGPLGLAAMDLACRSDVCPLSNRNYELWQPLMALAAWLEELGATGLLATVQGHAAHVAEASSEDATPDSDETILRAVAEEIMVGRTPSAGELLAKVKAVEPDIFQRWLPRTVSNALKRYGLVTKRYGADGRRYRDVGIADLRKIEQTYFLDLGIGECPPG